MPKDFEEFFERDRLIVRRWLMKRMRGKVGRDALLDLEQDLLMYLCSLSEKSKFRRKGTNGRRDGCTDVIQCFDPVRHFGATAGRFHNFVNLCLANRLNTILSGQRRSPLHHPNNMSICGSEPESDSSEGTVSEEYLLNHSRKLAADCRKRAGSEDMVLRIFISEFVFLAKQKAPETLSTIEAIQSTGTFKEAQQRVGIESKEFRKHREQLAILRDMFLERRSVKNAGSRF